MLPAVALGLLVSAPARAATLMGPITGWASGVPDSTSMYEYVPDKLAAKPPVLVVAHYCGGSAAGMFGIAKGGGIVAAADQYGFILIFPQTSNGCWDVSSKASLTHNGGGDTQAIAEMVAHVISKYDADADRVYATGQSSGGMITEALLAVYPDVFKAGAEFSGVPAGCSNVFDSKGLCGLPPLSAQQWGDKVRGMYPGYAGYRPRVQLWHGTADDLINYNNQTEAIKEWTNVLGLSATPTSTQSVMFNSHQWTRESWTSSCGFTVLDAWSEQGGPHNTDASENAMYVIPFLGLDKTGPTDPEVAACEAGSSSSSGGGASSSSSGGGASSSSSGGGAVSLGSTSGSSSGTTGSGGSSGTSPGTSGGGESIGASGGDGSTSSSAGCSCDVAHQSGSGGALTLAGLVALGAAASKRRRSSGSGVGGLGGSRNS